MVSNHNYNNRLFLPIIARLYCQDSQVVDSELFAMHNISYVYVHNRVVAGYTHRSFLLLEILHRTSIAVGPEGHSIATYVLTAQQVSQQCSKQRDLCTIS